MTGQGAFRVAWRQGLTPLALALLSCRWATASLASLVCCVPQATAQLLDGEVENLLIL